MDVKFNVGDKVQYKGDSAKTSREVISFSYNSEIGKVFYKVTSREVDNVEKEIIEGYITVEAEDLTPFKEIEPAPGE